MELVRIKNLRKHHDYTQIQVADYLGVAKYTYSNYENGKTTTPLNALVKLSEYYNTSVDYLIGFTDDPVPHQRKHRK